ncbi:MAG: sporulation protein YunB [Oscillospiraceae bacterium]|nr:sporulation protein YunB [Oscillospiraceae bacterium]
MGRVGRRWMRRIVVLILIIVILMMVFRKKYNDPIRELAQIQIMNATSDLINDAIDRQIEAGDIRYDRIVYFEKDLDGRITALKTNMSEVNRLKTDTLNMINDEILALDTSDLGIPLGSLFFPEFLSGRGPIIPVQIISIRNSDAYFTSDFSQAGINQTLHQLDMCVGVDVAVLILGETATFTVTSQVMVAQTIIVGTVPDTFLQTGGAYGNETKGAGADTDPE